MKIIIISGTPGCGKTTVSIKITELVNAKLISLNELTINNNFTIKYDYERETYVADSNRIIPYIEELIYLNRNKNIDYLIIEGHFSDIVPNNLIDYALVLRCNPYELWNRLEKRGYKKEKIRENVQSEILGDCANYILQKKIDAPLYEIETSNLSILSIAEIIVDLIKNKAINEKYKIGKIDWLEFLAEKDSIHEFFD